jgi:ribonucleotide reductase alpha subunit
MIEIFKKFISDLKLSDQVIRSLDVVRTNNELKIYALSLPDLVYPDTYILAGRIFIYLNIMTAPKKIESYIEILDGILRPEIVNFLAQNAEELDQMLEETYYYNFKDHNILSASKCVDYLLKISKEDPPVETPCLMMLRQAVQFYHDEGIYEVKRCYYELIDQEYVHASPTMFNAGTKKNQMSSCFLLSIDDNLEDLTYTGVGDVSMISRHQGGIGMALNHIRHSAISNTGKSSGILPFARIYDATIRCVDQGGKRNGAATLSVNDWHIDAFEFSECRDNYTHNGIRLKQANTALFVSTLFMERVREGGKWTLFCPSKAHLDNEKLVDKNGQEFEDLYVRLEQEIPKRKEVFDKVQAELQKVEKIVNSSECTEDDIKSLHLLTRKRVKARKNLIDYRVLDARAFYEHICDMNVKGTFPYVVYTDSMNGKNNTSNIGKTQSSNLCVAPETLILTDKGYVTISKYENKVVKIWNGQTYSEVMIKKTGENQEMIRVKIRDGTYITCTGYHKFYLEDGTEVRAEDLRKGMRLIEVEYPVVMNDKCEYFSKHERWNLESLEERIDFLKLLVEDNASSVGTGMMIEIEKEDSWALKLFLQSLGIASEKTDGGVIMLNKSIPHLQKLGLDVSKRYDFESFDYRTIEGIEETGETSDTYCFNEPLRHMGIFDGIPAGNCLEITLPSNPDMISSCNLGHVNLKRFVKTRLLEGEDIDEKYYDFNHLGRAIQSLVKNIDKVVTFNYYPLDKRDDKGNVIEEGKIHKPNIANRPLGIGVSGLSEAFTNLNLPYESDEAIQLNKNIFAAMYFNAVYKSCLLAQEFGEYETFRSEECKIFDKESNCYKTYQGSPLSNGFFQFDLWRCEADYLESVDQLQKDIYRREDDEPIDPYDWGNDLPVKSWEELRKLVMEHGVRNSMLIALMPTASSAQMLRNAETTEAHQTLIYSRKLAHGNYTTFSEPFVRDMIREGLWNRKTIDFINVCNGSIDKLHRFVAENPRYFSKDFYSEIKSEIPGGPAELKIKKSKLLNIMDLRQLHKGMYEISQKVTARMARQRGIYVCHSQSFNVYFPDPSKRLMSAFHLFTNALRLKTGMYYLRANPASQTGKFTTSIEIQKYHRKMKKTKAICTEDECIMCQ